MRGYIDGDGSYSINRRFENAISPLVYSRLYVSYTITFSLSDTEFILIKIISYFFNIPEEAGSIADHISEKTNEITEKDLIFSGNREGKSIIDWATANPPIGNKRLQQLGVLQKLIKENGKERDYALMKDLFISYYAIPPSKSNPPKDTLKEALQKLQNYFRYKKWI